MSTSLISSSLFQDFKIFLEYSRLSSTKNQPNISSWETFWSSGDMKTEETTNWQFLNEINPWTLTQYYLRLFYNELVASSLPVNSLVELNNERFNQSLSSRSVVRKNLYYIWTWSLIEVQRWTDHLEPIIKSLLRISPFRNRRKAQLALAILVTYLGVHVCHQHLKIVTVTESVTKLTLSSNLFQKTSLEFKLELFCRF